MRIFKDRFLIYTNKKSYKQWLYSDTIFFFDYLQGGCEDLKQYLHITFEFVYAGIMCLYYKHVKLLYLLQTKACRKFMKSYGNNISKLWVFWEKITLRDFVGSTKNKSKYKTKFNFLPSVGSLRTCYWFNSFTSSSKDQ